MKRACVLQHVPFEGPGSMGPWLEARGFTLTVSRLFDAEGVPSVSDMDLLIIMGGPMSVHDEAAYPWLGPEKALVREAAAVGVPMLGVCLGAQLIAEARGGRVYPGPEKEIGWFPVRGVPATGQPVFQFPDELEAFHWHGETFDPPPGAIRLASSDLCPNQAFQWGPSVIGLQFHLETTPESARALCTHCAHELVPGPYIQTADTILQASAGRYERMHGLMGEVLAYLTKGGSLNARSSGCRATRIAPPCG